MIRRSAADAAGPPARSRTEDCGGEGADVRSDSSGSGVDPPLQDLLAVGRRPRRRDPRGCRGARGHGLHVDRADPGDHRPVHDHLPDARVRPPGLFPPARGRSRLRDSRDPGCGTRGSGNLRTVAELVGVGRVDQPGRARVRRDADPREAAETRVPGGFPERVGADRFPDRRRRIGAHRPATRHARHPQGDGELVRAAVEHADPSDGRQSVDCRLRRRNARDHRGLQAHQSEDPRGGDRGRPVDRPVERPGRLESRSRRDRTRAGRDAALRPSAGNRPRRHPGRHGRRPLMLLPDHRPERGEPRAASR